MDRNIRSKPESSSTKPKLKFQLKNDCRISEKRQVQPINKINKKEKKIQSDWYLIIPKIIQIALAELNSSSLQVNSNYKSKKLFQIYKPKSNANNL